MSLEAIGVTSIFGLPWVLKFLWGPFIDSLGTKRRWLLATQGTLCLLFLCLAFLVPLKNSTSLLAGLFFIAAFIAATHDIAIDGYYMEALDNNGQAKYVGYRVMAYRIAMMSGTGVIATIGTIYSWFYAFLIGALTMVGLFIFHYNVLKECGQKGGEIFRPLLAILRNNSFKIFLAGLAILAGRSLLQSEPFKIAQETYPVLQKLSFPGAISITLFLALIILWVSKKRLKTALTKNPNSFYGKSFLSFMDREGIGAILAFIIFIRAGEYMLSSMYSPFIVDLGIKAHYGWISAGIGLPFSIIGAMTGGWLISRFSLRKMIWPFLFLQNFTNLIYMGLAFTLSHYLAVNTGNANPIPLPDLALFSIAATQGFDQFSGGLGTAVLMTFLMRICLPQYKASHYAIGTGLMSISGLYAGTVSGFVTSWVGYSIFFGISFLLSLPGMALIFWLPNQDKTDCPTH